VRTLIDAGIFVFLSRSGAPRVKSRGAKLDFQFKLSFRKLFGLSNNIGLGSSDRFELSGSDLEKWLESPSKEILLKNLGKGYSDKDIADSIELKDEGNNTIELKDEGNNTTHSSTKEPKLFDVIKPTFEREPIEFNSDYLRQRVKLSKVDSVPKVDLLLIANGFEERCEHSIKKLLEKYSFNQVIMFEHNKKSENIEKMITEHFNNSTIKKMPINQYKDVIPQLRSYKNFLIDITGIHKPAIFDVVREAVKQKLPFYIAYTPAEKNYPTDEDIDEQTSKFGEPLNSKIFTAVMENLLTGVRPPYNNISLMNKQYDSLMRPTALIAVISPKIQRIFSLLDNNEYEQINIFVTQGTSHREQLSRTAAEIVAANYQYVKIEELNETAHDSFLNILLQKYYNLYNAGYNIELALTSTKMQTVAFAAFSAVCKIAQCWYVESGFDEKHFTKGFKDTHFYKIEYG